MNWVTPDEVNDSIPDTDDASEHMVGDHFAGNYELPLHTKKLDHGGAFVVVLDLL
jgi:hypothetical protein